PSLLATCSPRGLVSGITSTIPSSAATRWAPALVVKFSSLQVSPESQYNTGGGVLSRGGGKKILNVIVQFKIRESCRQRCCQPSKQRCSSSNSMRGSLLCCLQFLHHTVNSLCRE